MLRYRIEQDETNILNIIFPGKTFIPPEISFRKAEFS